MRLPLRFPYFWLACAWILAIAICVASQLPSDDLPNLHVSDKIEHAACYFALTLVFTGIYTRDKYWVVGTLLVAMGVLNEIFQYLLHLGRTADVMDALANSVGVLIAIVLSLAGLGGWTQRIEKLFARV
jgi:VanZ family protein